MNREKFRDKIIENMMLLDDAIKITLEESFYETDEDIDSIIAQNTFHITVPDYILNTMIDNVYNALPHDHSWHEEYDNYCEKCVNDAKDYDDTLQYENNKYNKSR